MISFIIAFHLQRVLFFTSINQLVLPIEEFYYEGFRSIYLNYFRYPLRYADFFLETRFEIILLLTTRFERIRLIR